MNKIKRLLRQILGFFPSKIPTGITEWDAWVQSIKDTYTLPTVEDSDLRFCFATMVINLGPTAAYKPKWYFVLAIRAGAAKQIAGAIFHEIKLKQIEQKKAQSKPVEATAPSNTANVVSLNGPQKP